MTMSKRQLLQALLTALLDKALRKRPIAQPCHERLLAVVTPIRQKRSPPLRLAFGSRRALRAQDASDV